MYAPVVHRFKTYAIEVSSPVAAYMSVMEAEPAFAAWTRAGLIETMVIPQFEVE